MSDFGNLPPGSNPHQQADATRRSRFKVLNFHLHILDLTHTSLGHFSLLLVFSLPPLAPTKDWWWISVCGPVAYQGKPGPQEFIHFSGGACFFSRHMFCHLGFCFPFLTNIESFLCASNMRETFEMNMEEPACQEYDDILFGISLQEIYQRNMEVSTFQGYDDISFGISQPSFAFKKTCVSMVWLWNSENWRQPYILKAKRFAESAFQSRKICGKSA